MCIADEPQGTSIPSSSRANADPTEEAEADSEAGDEPDLTLPSSGSVGLVSSDGLLSHDCQSEIRQMVIQGNVWTSARGTLVCWHSDSKLTMSSSSSNL